MSKGLMGKKVGMTTWFDEAGTAHPVTILQVDPNLVFGHRTTERDGYTALQLAYGELNEAQTRRANKPKLGEYAKRNLKAHAAIVEFRVDEKQLGEHAVGSHVTVELFKKGEHVDVTGVTRGMGFAGVMKRHHMKGAARDSSTAHEYHRHMGAVGQRKTPGRVFKNKRMPGHMGVDRRTVQNLKIVEIMADQNLILVSGSVPGHRKGAVMVRPAVMK